MIVNRNKRKGTKQANIWFYLALTLSVFVFYLRLSGHYIYRRQVESSEREVIESTSSFYVNSSSISGRQRKHRAFARMAVWCIILVTSGIILEDLNCCLLALLAHG